MSVINLKFRIGEEMLKKLCYITCYENFSVNGQIILFLQKCINEFEEEHGEINFDKPENENIHE